MSGTFRGDIQRAAEDFAGSVRRRDQDAADALTRSYAEVRARLAAQYDDLLREIGRRNMGGEDVGNALRNQFSRVATLLRQADAELLDWAASASEAIRQEQAAAVAAAQAEMVKLAAVTMGPGPGGITAAFNRLPAEAVAELVGVLQDGRPLADLLDVYGKQASQDIRAALVNGLAQGLHPFEIARNMRAAMDGAAVRALTTARTEVLRAYRESSLRFFKANSDLIDGWLWWSARDKTTCPVCWAMHGTRHSLDEHFGSHPNCRCTMLPITKTWKELGFGDVPGDRPLNIEEGERAFRRLPTDAQRVILGRSKFAAWSRGDIDLADVVNFRNDPRWGPTRTEASLKDALERNNAKRPPAPKPTPARKPRATDTSPPKGKAAIVKWLEDRGVYVHPNSTRRITVEDLRAVAADIAKMPRSTLDAMKAAGTRTDLVVGQGITAHPNFAHLKGVIPRGYKSGKTWDNVPGGGASGPGGTNIIVANRLHSGHGSANLIMHELAHGYDGAGGFRAISHGAEWMQIHTSQKWPSAYERNYPEESYAESFAKYFAGDATRSTLPQMVRDYFGRHFK